MEVQQLKSVYSVENTLSNCAEITEADKVRLKYIILFLFEVEKRREFTLKNVKEEKFSEAKKDMDICEYLKWNPVFQEMKKDLFEHGNANLINKIAEKQPFISKSGTYSESAFSIPFEILPTLSSYYDTTVSKDNPKAIAYKILGAKVI